jgi:multiple antibiotic resistance protein
MRDVLRLLFVTLGALLPIVNPLGGAPIFLAMSADLPGHARHRLAIVVARNTFLMLAAAMLVGSYVLQFFGISIPIVRVGGGLLVIASGWRLLHEDHPEPVAAPPVNEAWERELGRRGFYPLTFPLTVGPGSISIAITLGAAGGFTNLAIVDLATNLTGVALVALTVFLSYRFAARLIDALGETGTVVFLRLSAFILLCIGVGIFWSGIVGLIETLPAFRGGKP